MAGSEGWERSGAWTTSVPLAVTAPKVAWTGRVALRLPWAPTLTRLSRGPASSVSVMRPSLLASWRAICACAPRFTEPFCTVAQAVLEGRGDGSGHQGQGVDEALGRGEGPRPAHDLIEAVVEGLGLGTVEDDPAVVVDDGPHRLSSGDRRLRGAGEGHAEGLI